MMKLQVSNRVSRTDVLSAEFAEGRDVLPLEYYVDFLRFLKGSDRIEIITYRDFDWGGDFDYRAKYPQERRNWEQRLSSGELDDSKIYVVLQHDVDSFPERTMQMLEAEARLGVASTSMIFAERINRSVLADEGRIEKTPYDLDFNELRRLQGLGFVFGYHCNAYERAEFDVARAQRLFDEDVTRLRDELAVDFFSPHGGVRDAAGQSNSSVEPAEHLRNTIRWVHNRFGPHFSGAYSDGGIVFGNRHGEEYDLAKFVQSWKPGRRYRVLIHPQYYHTDVKRAKSLVGMPWYERALDRFGTPQDADSTMQYWGSTRSIFQRLERKLWRTALRTEADAAVADAPPPIVTVGDPVATQVVSQHLQSNSGVALSPPLEVKQLRSGCLTGNRFEWLHRTNFWRWLQFRVVSAWPWRSIASKGWSSFCDANQDLGTSRILSLAEEHLRSGFSFADNNGCLRFAARCGIERMILAGKKRWTLSGDVDLDVVQQLWPDAKFVVVGGTSEIEHAAAFRFEPSDNPQVTQERLHALSAFLG